MVTQPINPTNIEYGSNVSGILLGNAYSNTAYNGNKGRALAGYESFIVVPAATTSLVAAVAPTGNGYLTLVPSVSTIYGVNNGLNPNVVTLDTPRNVVVTTGGAVTTQGTISIYGYDYQGFSMVETITVPVAGAIANYYGRKAFAYIYGVYATIVAGFGTTVAVATSTLIGLPTALLTFPYSGSQAFGSGAHSNTGYVVNAIYNGTATAALSSNMNAAPATPTQINAGFVIWDSTTPSATTGDVRGGIILTSITANAALQVTYINAGCSQSLAQGIFPTTTTVSSVTVGDTQMTYGVTQVPVTFP